MKLIFCGGGTAGHITPAIAIAEKVLQKIPEAEILFVGREGGDENQTVKKRGFELKTLKISGFERKICLKNLQNLHTAMAALKKAKKIIREFSADVVIGTGGYVCWPILKSAQRLGIPTVIHESNATPGLAAKLLSKKCDRVLLNLEGSESQFKRQDNIRIVGNPVRKEFLTTDRATARKRLGLSGKDFFIFSFGGSGGSRKLNDSVIELMESHSTKNKNVRHIHACGRKYFNDIKKNSPHLTCGKAGCIIKPYVDEMALMMKAADVVIARAGAMTLAEIAASSTAAILIPSPNVTNNHQYKNAKHLHERGAAIMIEESELSERSLCDAVKRLENNIQLRNAMAESSNSFFIPDSVEKITNEILNLTEENRRN